jgi:hypothetical protein
MRALSYKKNKLCLHFDNQGMRGGQVIPCAASFLRPGIYTAGKNGM